MEVWLKAAGAFVAVLMAVLVPVRSWYVEDRRFRAQALNALASASRTTLVGVTSSPTMLADALAISALADALNRVAATLERLTEQDRERGNTRLTLALERFLAAQGESPTG